MNYAKAKVYYDGQRQRQKSMENDDLKKEIESFIASQKICCMATGSGSAIRNTTMQYNYYDGCFWFLTEGGHKFDGLETNKNVSLAIYTTDRPDGKNIGLQISGTAEVFDASSDESKDILNLRQITKQKLEKIGHPIYVIKISPISFEIINAAFEQKGFGKRQLLILA